MEQIPSNTPVMESSPGPAGWLPVWIKAVTQPNEQTFVDITEHPDASARTAYIWIFIVGTLTGIVQAIVSTIRLSIGLGSQFQQIPGMEQYLPQTTGGSAGVTLLVGLCGSPLAGLLSVAFFALFAAIIQWIAKMFGGTGTYEKMLYALAAISVPFSLVSVLLVFLGMIPFVGICTGLISIGLAVYSLVLQVMAVKGVNHLDWGQAAGSVLLPGCVVVFLCACVVGGSIALLVPVFQNANFAP